MDTCNDCRAVLVTVATEEVNHEATLIDARKHEFPRSVYREISH